jgi:hypothetical protein
LIATGVFLTGQGIIQADALNWENLRQSGRASIELTERPPAVQDERDLAIFQELGEWNDRINIAGSMWLILGSLSI